MQSDLQHLSVIVVDDNADNLFILTDTLKEDFGLQRVESAKSGRMMFDLLAHDPTFQPDLILLDLQMPYEDGYIVLQQSRQHAQLQATLIVAVTANVMPQDLIRCQQAGFDGFIGKPISLEHLLSQLQRIITKGAVWEPRP